MPFQGGGEIVARGSLVGPIKEVTFGCPLHTFERRGVGGGKGRGRGEPFPFSKSIQSQKFIGLTSANFQNDVARWEEVGQ